METRTQGGVWGTALCMAGIAASLSLDPCLEVIHLDPRILDSATALSALRPQATLFELTSLPPGLDVAILHEYPDMILVGVDPVSGRVMVFTGREERLVSISGLVQMIREEAERGAQRRANDHASDDLPGPPRESPPP